MVRVSNLMANLWNILYIVRIDYKCYLNNKPGNYWISNTALWCSMRNVFISIYYDVFTLHL